MPFSNLELTEWHRKVENFALQEYDEQGKIITPRSPPSPRAVGTQQSLSFVNNDNLLRRLYSTGGGGEPSPEDAFGDAGDESSTQGQTHRPSLSTGKPVRYAALELLTANPAVQITRDPHDAAFLNSLTSSSIKPLNPSMPKFRRRAISGAAISSSTGKEGFMRAKKGISRADLVRSRLALPVERASKTLKLAGTVQKVEDKLNEIRADPELRLQLQNEIQKGELEAKARFLENLSHDSIVVNVERVKQGYYTKAVSKMVRLQGKMKEVRQGRREDGGGNRTRCYRCRYPVNASSQLELTKTRVQRLLVSLATVAFSSLTLFACRRGTGTRTRRRTGRC